MWLVLCDWLAQILRTLLQKCIRMLLFSASYSVRYSANAIQVRWPIFADFIADHFLLEWWKIIKIGEQNQIYLINKSGLVFFHRVFRLLSVNKVLRYDRAHLTVTQLNSCSVQPQFCPVLLRVLIRFRSVEPIEWHRIKGYLRKTFPISTAVQVS